MGSKVVRDSYLQLPTGGLYRASDLIAGEQILIESQLLRREGELYYPSASLEDIRTLDEDAACEIILTAWLTSNPPLWFRLSIRDGSIVNELIPSEELASLSNLLPELGAREALLLAASSTYDQSHNRELGRLGEEHVVEMCKQELRGAGLDDLSEQVKQVSLIDDRLGYDVISPSVVGSLVRLEVKTARHPGRTIQIYLSRNEFEVGLRRKDWYMVVCGENTSSDIAVIGWCQAHALRQYVPLDRDPMGHWQSVRIMLSRESLISGLPIATNKVPG